MIYRKDLVDPFGCLSWVSRGKSTRIWGRASKLPMIAHPRAKARSWKKPNAAIAKGNNPADYWRKEKKSEATSTDLRIVVGQREELERTEISARLCCTLQDPGKEGTSEEAFHVR